MQQKQNNQKGGCQHTTQSLFIAVIGKNIMSGSITDSIIRGCANIGMSRASLKKIDAHRANLSALNVVTKPMLM